MDDIKEFCKFVLKNREYNSRNQAVKQYQKIYNNTAPAKDYCEETITYALEDYYNITRGSCTVKMSTVKSLTDKLLKSLNINV